MRDHNYQSITKNCHTRFIVTVENEKSLCEKKKITIREYRLVFFEPVNLSSQGTVFWRDYLSLFKMAEQLSAEDFTEFIDSLRSIVERTASVYRALPSPNSTDAITARDKNIGK